MSKFEIFVIEDGILGKYAHVVETIEADSISYTPGGMVLYAPREGWIISEIIYTVPVGCGVRKVIDEKEPLVLKTQADVLKAFKEGRLKME